MLYIILGIILLYIALTFICYKINDGYDLEDLLEAARDTFIILVIIGGLFLGFFLLAYGAIELKNKPKTEQVERVEE